MSAHGKIQSIVSPAKDAFHEMGDVLAGRLMNLRQTGTNGNTNGNGVNSSQNSQSCQNEVARVATGLIHVIMHLSDCARYEEKPERSLYFAEFIRTLEPDNPEAHMRIALTLPTVPRSDESVGSATLQAFFHFCVFLSNRGVPCDSPEAKVVERAASRAKEWAYTLDRQATPPEKIALFAARFISAAWTILTDEIPAARKAAAKQNNAKLWAAIRDIAITDKKGAERVQLEESLIHAVGIAIFIRYRLCRQGNFNTAVDEKRTAAADCFLRNFAAILCDAVCANVDQVIIAVRRRHKNRGRVRQRKRRKLNNNNNNSNQKAGASSKKQQQQAELTPDELRMGAFEELASMDMMPASLGALAALCHFWSKTMDSVDIDTGTGIDVNMDMVSQQMSQYVALYRRLKKVGKVMDRLQEVSGTTLYWERIRSTLMIHSEVPSLAEDVHLCNFGACRDVSMFKNRVHMKIPADSFLKYDDNPDHDANNDYSGMLHRAVNKMGRQKYESIVRGACGRHLEAFAQRISKKVSRASNGNNNRNSNGSNGNSNSNRNTKPKELTSSAACALVMFAIRKQRIGRMTRYLETYQDGIIKTAATDREKKERDNAANRRNGNNNSINIDAADDDDILETPDSNEGEELVRLGSSQMPGQLKRRARRNSSEDADSAYYARNMAKRRKVNGTNGSNSGISTAATTNENDNDNVQIRVTQASNCSGTGSSGVSTVSPPDARQHNAA